MSEPDYKAEFFSKLRVDDEKLWSIIPYLAKTSEPERRRLLRPHAEAGFDFEQDQPLLEKRLAVDRALGKLTLLEIAFELQLVSENEVAEHSASFAVILEQFKGLLGSQALLRYASAYLYFGIRLLAGRIAPPAWFVSRPAQPLTRSNNERSFPLASPPPVPPTESTNQRFRVFLRQRRTTTVEMAQAFLDDFLVTDSELEELQKITEPEQRRRELERLLGDRDPNNLELWLRGLRPETDVATDLYFRRVSAGMMSWARERATFYRQFVEPTVGGWKISDPAAARFVLADMYWIARLFRADVSADCVVSYSRSNWLHLKRFNLILRHADERHVEELEEAEKILRTVFGFACDLVQNSVEVTREKELQAYAPEAIAEAPEETVKWRQVYDEELEEISRQRKRRTFRDESAQPSSAPADAPPPNDPVRPRAKAKAEAKAKAKTKAEVEAEVEAKAKAKAEAEWRWRIRTGKETSNLFGIALSGGGVRSATFCLGVLQGLQELDMLQYADYLSTVSGGGFIGSWLAANVSRTSHWLGRLTNWDESIAHLRRYSSYLSPKTGILSSDTWTMWTSWARNALLIQLTGLAWMLAILLLALSAQSLFYTAGALPGLLGNVSATGMVTGLMAALILWTLLYNLSGERAVSGVAKPFAGHTVRLLAVLPAWIGSFLLASLFWADATGRSPVASKFTDKNCYSCILKAAITVRPWQVIIITLLVVLFAIAFRTLRDRHRWLASIISPLCVAALYLQLCGIMRLFAAWHAKADPRFDWYAFVLGPPLVLIAHAVTIVLFIGFCGRYSNEPLREWWTRFGTWLFIFGAIYLFITTAAVFGPPWILHFSQAHPKISGGALAGWIGSVVSGLLAGKSSKTGSLKSSSPLLEWVARAAGLLFIVGAVLGTSTLLYVILYNVGTNCGAFGEYWNVVPEISIRVKIIALAVALACGGLFSWFFEINIFGLNQFYRNRLVRCYLGATRWAPGVRNPQPFTKFDGRDDVRLSNLRTGYQDAYGRSEFRGPFPILNCALNLGGSSDLSVHTRQSASFSLTPLRCGADRARVGYAPTPQVCGKCFANGVMLGQAVSVSGAAASPNMGYNTSPVVAYLLTMFNVRLGWWFPNPGRNRWFRPGLQFSLYYLTMELFGIADETSAFVNVSDGGHFDNLGIYELVRRQCTVILAVDAECDEQLTFGSLGNVVRLCETDFGAKIELDVSSIRQQKDGLSTEHCAVGRIVYSNGSLGYLIYLKASISGDEDIGVAQYRSAHPSFPHETTADQFFSEDQFESYRRLGRHVVLQSLRGTQPGDHPVDTAERLVDVLTPSGCSSEISLKHAHTLENIWQQFRRSPELYPFMNELVLGLPRPRYCRGLDSEMSIGLELIQLMEDVFLDLRLDDFWERPDNRGWAILFMRWARSTRFREIWNQTHRAFGIRFEYFCAARLGLKRDRPIVRV